MHCVFDERQKAERLGIMEKPPTTTTTITTATVTTTPAAAAAAAAVPHGSSSGYGEHDSLSSGRTESSLRKGLATQKACSGSENDRSGSGGSPFENSTKDSGKNDVESLTVLPVNSSLVSCA